MLIATTHKNTDFDALASVIGATLLYPGCVGVVPKQVNPNVAQFLSTHKTAFSLILPHEIDPEKVKKLIVVDTDQWHRLDRMDGLRNRPELEIDVWDHHMNVKGNIESSWICKEHIGSTTTLIVREIRKREIELTPLESTILLIGLYEDTGHLSFPSTTSEDAYAAAFLLEKKADLNVAGFFLNPPYEETQKEILFRMMKNTEKKTINGLLVGFNCVKLDKKVESLASVVSMYRKIVNVNALFVIFSWDDKRSTVIGRSGGQNINMGRILSHFGGGGHAGAGSATIKREDASPEEIVERITELIESSCNGVASISDIMSFPVVSISPEATMREAQEVMNQGKIRGVLVTENGKIEGIIVLWDLKRVKKERQWESPVKAFMSRDVITISPTTSPIMAARLMIEKDVGYLPVLQDGEVIGIVTRTDILTYYYDLLPE